MPVVKQKTQKRLFLFFVAFTLVVIGIATLCLQMYRQSELLKNQGDALIKLNQPAEAIVFYKKAQSVFPLRSDLADDIAGAQLILQSKNDYESITDFSEIQTPPPLTNLPSVQLAPNELFVPVLMYHHIEINPRPNDPLYASLFVSPSQLDQQLAYFSTNNFHAITLDDMANALDNKETLPPNPIVLSFDDGYQSFYDNAYPLLQKYHMKAIEFVITQVEGAPAYLSWNEIKQMDQSGLVEFGAHTRHHPNLPDLSQAAIIDEIQGSKNDLEQHLNHPVNWFAYPYGSYSSFIIQTVKDAGFKGAASTIYGASQSKDNAYLFPRIMVDGRFSIDNIAKRIQE
ncbi:MAG TPA: polysaccharide deacetylase family protein [Patescibacteria group bacterium]|nr:polysaccharide deacetylase family protein [Patescibacteria group bacterium]